MKTVKITLEVCSVWVIYRFCDCVRPQKRAQFSHRGAIFGNFLQTFWLFLARYYAIPTTSFHVDVVVCYVRYYALHSSKTSEPKLALFGLNRKH